MQPWCGHRASKAVKAPSVSCSTHTGSSAEATVTCLPPPTGTSAVFTRARTGSAVSIWRCRAVVRDGRARLAEVGVGRTNGLETEVLGGLQDGDVVVLHPSDRVEDGVRVAPR